MNLSDLPEDNGTNIIRLDPDQRENAQIRINDPIQIRWIAENVGAITPAESLVIRPIGNDITIQDPNLLARLWQNRIVAKKQKITLFLMNQTYTFMVANCEPAESYVKIDSLTTFTIKEVVPGEEKSYLQRFGWIR